MTNKTQIVDSLEDLIGNTPLVRLNKIASNVPATVTVKLEQQNPGGSSKDRAAKEMIDAAEREGLLKPGGTIIEPTSGNTGTALAIIAAQRGYKTIFVVTDKVSQEKVDLLRAYGSEVVVCPVAVQPEDPRSYYSVAERLTSETIDAFRPDQYSNPNNPLAHYKTTGPEIWQQSGSKITHFIAGMGTGGTISGIGKYLKEQNPNIKIIGADPENSVYSGGSGRPYLTEGVGEDFFPATYDRSIIDEIIPISDAEAFAAAKDIAYKEGLLVGGSGAMAITALNHIKNLKEDDFVVVLVPDSGRGYISKIFNDSWMQNFGFEDEIGVPTVQDLLSEIGATSTKEKIIYVNPDATVRNVVELMRKHDISQLPVAKNKPPFAAAEIIGSIEEISLLSQVSKEPWLLDVEVEKIMNPPLATIGKGQSIDVASLRLETDSVLVVLDGGQPTGIVSRSDLLTYFSKRTQHIEGVSHVR